MLVASIFSTSIERRTCGKSTARSSCISSKSKQQRWEHVPRLPTASQQTWTESNWYTVHLTYFQHFGISWSCANQQKPTVHVVQQKALAAGCTRSGMTQLPSLAGAWEITRSILYCWSRVLLVLLLVLTESADVQPSESSASVRHLWPITKDDAPFVLQPSNIDSSLHLHIISHYPHYFLSPPS